MNRMKKVPDTFNFPRVQTDHLRFWAKCPVPVFLAVHECPGADTYILNCQAVARRTRDRFGGQLPDFKTVSISLSKEDLLSSSAMEKIATSVSEYWSRWNPTEEEKLAISAQGAYAPLAWRLLPVYLGFVNRITSLRKRLEEAIGSELCGVVNEMRLPCAAAF